MKRDTLGRLGNLETRLAHSPEEIAAAQRLRYDVFYTEMGAQANAKTRQTERDEDAFDVCCDHLLVTEWDDKGRETIVGTYRLLLDSKRNEDIGFYSAGEFDLSAFRHANSGSRLMELGRSCILPQYRSKRTMELLWHGTWAYAVRNKVDVMFGCASFQSTDQDSLVEPLAWLGQNARVDVLEDCRANTAAHIDLTVLDIPHSNIRRAFAQMPPLLKGYLRLGAKVASHAVVDRQFGTTDVLVVLKVADINPRYLAHFGADASRFAA